MTVSLLGKLSTGSIVVICVIAVIFVGTFTTSLVKYLKNRKKHMEEADREVEDVDVKHGVRYTDDQTVVTELGDMHISFGEGDKVLKQNVTYTATKKTGLLPGKYTILSTSGNEESFNVRIGTYVKEYKHGESIVLAEGEEITPVSTGIILR